MIDLRRLAGGIALACTLAGASTVVAQDKEEKTDKVEEAPKRFLRVNPASLRMEVGETAQLNVVVVGEDGKALEEEVFYFARGRRSLTVSQEGLVSALKPGEFSVSVRTARGVGDRLSVDVPVFIATPPIERIEWAEVPEQIFARTTVLVKARVTDRAGLDRPEARVSMRSSSPEVAKVDPFGNLNAIKPGPFAVIAEVEGLSIARSLEVLENPARSVELKTGTAFAQTGDVLRFESMAFDAEGRPLPAVPVYLSFHAKPDDQLGQAATGQIEQDGRFVAEQPGIYTVVADCGTASTQFSVRIDQRQVQQKVVVKGQGQVHDVHTSDLWVWEGVDGRDYAVTGTWGANGDALFWDVTDPSDLKQISKVTVDARTVNDVKVSEDGRICVISREGASNRKNGIVIIDVVKPAEPKVISEFTDELTGGVHNVFIYKNHVYALSAGRRYDIINIEDPTKPHRVGKFELEEPGHSIHDVWVEDGIAYSSNWSNGLVLVDVGNGVAGGSPSNPVEIGRYAYPSGWNHAAFPYHDKQTGKEYVIGGDEAFPHGLHTKDKPTYPRGWMHFVDFTDKDNPQEVARYQVPEAGTHNLWVEGDTMYAAFYNGGLRVVDLSGELMGDLYRQGREIAWFLPTHHEAKIPNAPMVWGPQPHKGHIFFSDWNSGLWSVKLEPKDKQ